MVSNSVAPSAFAWTPDRSRIVTYDDSAGRIRVFDTASQVEIGDLAVPEFERVMHVSNDWVFFNDQEDRLMWPLPSIP